jgi:hypothetical protein
VPEFRGDDDDHVLCLTFTGVKYRPKLRKGEFTHALGELKEFHTITRSKAQVGSGEVNAATRH